MRISTSVCFVGLLGFAFLSPGPSIAQESCDSLIANLNRVADQITDARKKAEDEDECHAEAAAWAKAGALIEQRIALRQKAEKVCGDALENGVTVDRLRESLKLMRKFEADAKDEDDCKQEAAKDTKPTPNTPVELNTELTPSGTIPCFGGGTCKSSHDNGPPNGSPAHPAPNTKPSTLTGKQFGDKEPPSPSGGVIPAK